MRSPGGRLHRWDDIIRVARLTPGAWVVKLPDELARMVRTVRNREAPELRLGDGRLEAQVVNVYRDQWGRKRGDVYIRYVPSDSLNPEGDPNGAPQGGKNGSEEPGPDDPAQGGPA